MAVPMIVAMAIGVVLFVGAVWLHLWSLGRARALIPDDKALQAGTTTGIFLIVLASHLAVAALFAIGFWAAQRIGLGGFSQEPIMGVMDYFYFSLVNVTTLGLGDIYPTGHLRVIGGIESLTGFLLISCSAQLIFKTMKKQEQA